MADFRFKDLPRTGLVGISSKQAPDKDRSRPKPILKPIVISDKVRPRSVIKPAFNMESVRDAYLADGYVKQALDKYADLILKDGWDLEGEVGPKEAVLSRIREMEYASGIPWPIIIERITRDLVIYANAFLIKVSGSNGRTIAYFPAPPFQMKPMAGEDGQIEKWVQVCGDRKTEFDPEDVKHFAYCRDAGGVWGIPDLAPVVEDVLALRQAEENVLKLVHKHLNPLIHQQVPDITGTGEGRQEDIEDAVRNFQSTATDGYIITPPGHKISVVGAESQAIRAEGYLKLFKQRVFSGLNVSELIMGENTGANLGSSDVLSAQMYNRARMFQRILSLEISLKIFNEILREEGFDPISNPKDRVSIIWKEFELEKQLKKQAHVLNMWTMNTISLSETRKLLGITSDPDLKDFYSHRIQIPQLLSARTGADPLENPDQKPNLSGNIPIAKITKTPGQLEINREFENIYENILEKITQVKSGEIGVDEFASYVFNGEVDEGYYNLASEIYSDIYNLNDEFMYAMINARLSNFIGVAKEIENE